MPNPSFTYVHDPRSIHLPSELNWIIGFKEGSDADVTSPHLLPQAQRDLAGIRHISLASGSIQTVPCTKSLRTKSDVSRIVP